MTREKRSQTDTRYLFRAKRRDGRVVKEYVGSLADPVVQILARQERLNRAECQAAQQACSEEQKRYQQIEVLLELLQGQLRQLFWQWKHYHKRQRAKPGDNPTIRWKGKTMAGKVRQQPLTRDEFEELVKRAELGNTDARDQLRSMMRADPETWHHFGDLTEHVNRIYLELLVKDHVIAREALLLKLEQLRDELQQGHSSFLRQLTIDQILILWLDLHYQNILVAGPHDKRSDRDALIRRRERAKKRFQAALESLGKMDRILGLAPPKIAGTRTEKHAGGTHTEFIYDHEI